ncbi:MAG: hypothetical protein IH623_17860 [Verrucomicrobia bacterium]|nr:hypothetical protein [Verrucomicrobiota bacterium]
MNSKQSRSNLAPILFAGLFSATLLLSSRPAVAQDGWLTLANPHWNITLTDAGYSDFLLDNTPGFEGREYLSGEWGAAVGYQLSDGAVVPPLWLEKNFWFPDWVTDSNFGVKSAIAQIGLNAENLPIAQAVLTNSHLEITLRHEMLDTVVGTPMGITPASSTDAGTFIHSDRYVLKQTCTVKNISGAAISNVQLFQLLHGLNSQRGLYDNRTYAGPLSEFRYDSTQAGVDTWAVGAGSSSAGLEDYISFHASVAPSAFENGHYGIEGNGVDDHSIGKPSVGVHLSIEDNWQNAPYRARAGTDFFAPAQRWVAGAQRWDLGNLAAGQSASLDVLLTLRTGTKVTNGPDKSGGCNGGSSVPGGLDYEFEDVSEDGSCFGDYSQADEVEVEARIAEGEFDDFSFLLPGGPVQLWEVEFSGSFSGEVHLNFGYDPTILPAGLDQTTLCLYQFTDHAWHKLPGAVNPVTHTIAVTVSSLSKFALGVDAAGETFTITGDVAPASSGTLSGPGDYAYGAQATIVATAAEGHAFASWTESGEVVSLSPGYNFIVRSNRTLTANFIDAGDGRTIATVAQPASGGATSGDGAYAIGASATVVGVPSAGYKFSKWLENGILVSSAATYTFTVSSNRTLTAKFKPVYSVVVSAEPENGGEVEADLFYEPGELAKLKAKPKTGWCFVNWTQNGVPVSTDPNFQFNVTGNRTLVGHFAQGNRIDASVYLGIGGTVSGGGVYQSGASVTVVANANSGYAFTSWTEFGEQVSTNDSYTFTCATNRVLLANFVAASTTTNSPPLAFGSEFFQLTGLPLAINITDLMWSDSDPDGDPITFVGVSATSSNGLALATNATQILVPANAVADGFSYIIADTHGVTAIGTATISIITNITSRGVALNRAPDGLATISFTGVPWYSYEVQRATNGTFTGTLQTWPVQAWADGSILIQDDFTDLASKPPQAFYRLRYNP